jgi:CBS domain containing-hemolysin-like protein
VERPSPDAAPPAAAWNNFHRGEGIIDAAWLAPLLSLLAFVALTGANALFVTAEYALVTVDRATVDHLAAGGDYAARRIRTALHHLSFQLSGAQLGITISSLLTGYLAGPAIATLIAPALEFLGSAADATARVLALVIATLFSMLFGELVPKNATIARPLPAARLTTRPLLLFSAVFAWLIRLLNGTANWLVRRLGVEPQEELASARSPDELGLLAAYSAQAGAVSEETALLLRRTIRFGEKRAAEAMTPRVDVIGVRATDTVQAAIEKVITSGNSRFPVYLESVDEVVGVVTLIDLIGVAPADRSTTPVRTVAREAVLVPESLDLDGVLATLQAAGQDLAIVVDEYGGTDGVVTIEDLVEELVGEIADEHDVVEPSLLDVTLPAHGEESDAAVTAPRTEHSWLVDGVLRSDELADLTGFRLPEGPYETLAGFIMARLGHIPVAGEEVRESGWDFTVIDVERRRIEQVRVAAPPEDEADHG